MRAKTIRLAEKAAYTRAHLPTEWREAYEAALRQATERALATGDYGPFDDVAEQWWRAARLEHHGGEGWQRQRRLIEQGRWDELLAGSEPVDVETFGSPQEGIDVNTADRIARALEYANAGQVDGEHYKAWAIDQMVRALLGCPIVTRTTTDHRGWSYSYEAQGESEEYRRFIAEYRAGKAGPDIHSWDEGIPP